MASIAEIISLLGMIEKLSGKIGEAWGKIDEYIKAEKDEKKREKLVAASERRDFSALRAALFD